MKKSLPLTALALVAMMVTGSRIASAQDGNPQQTTQHPAGQPSPAPSQSPSKVPEEMQFPSPTPTPSSSPSVSAPPTETQTPTPEPTPTPRQHTTPVPATGTPTPSPSVSPSPTPTPGPSFTAADLFFPPLNNREIVVVAVGDVMLGTTFPDDDGSMLPPDDGADLLGQVTPILKRGDVVFGNLEGPMLEGGTSLKCHGKKTNCYAFRVPTRYGKYLQAAGFTAMGLANNHAMDFGQEGRTSSRTVLDSLGIAHSGEIGDIAHLTVKGEKIEIVAFATYPGAYNLLDLDDALQTIRQARAESDIVIVSFHGGAEGATHQHVAEGDEKFLGEDRGDLRRFAHAAIDAGAQLVIGSGPHVVRGMEIYEGKLIAYSLGNFATYGPFNLNGENGISLILEAHLAPDGSFLGGQVYPIRQEKPGGPKLDPAMAILPVLRSLSQEDFGRNAVGEGSRGQLWLPGVQMPECSDAPDALDQPFRTNPCGIYP